MGVSLLKPVLAAAGFSCDVRYLNLTFANLLGQERYRWLAGELPYTAFAGEWSFTHLLYGARPQADERYLDEILRRTWYRSEADLRQLLEIRSLATYFLEHCLAAVPWSDYAVVGFSSTFEQNIASLALARRIKHLAPATAVVFGGANWEGEMGLELHRRFRFVDYVCSGESERSLPRLVERILCGTPPGDVPGIVYRAGDRSVSTGPPEVVGDLATLPMPDFSDYFEALAQSGAGNGVNPTLLLETSRGCWWGARSHCTFCGLNGASIAFRSKTAPRVLAELDHLQQYGAQGMVEAVDNILHMGFFQDLLPALAARKPAAQLFYEVKANLTRAQVELLHAAGVHRIQPGIESLSDHVLELMRKGTSALRNIQLMKWCKENQVYVDWNLLYGFPGETREDYAAMLQLLPAIKFLGPPAAWGPVRLDRFSPYFDAPGRFGLTNVRPLAAYAHLYPFRTESLARIAYCFDYDYAGATAPTGYADEVVQFLEAWKREPETGSLGCQFRPNGTLALLDSRSDATVRELELAGLERAAYEYCDQARPLSAVVRHLRATFPQPEFDERGVRGFLDSLVANRLMVTAGNDYLSLAVRDVQTRSGTGPGRGEAAVDWRT